MFKRLLRAANASALSRFAPATIPTEDPRLSAFMDYCREGGRRIQYADNRRVPLDLFSSRFRTLLLSDDPKTRDLVRSPSGFHSPLDILICDHLDHDEPPYLRAPYYASWKHQPVTNWLFPKLDRLPRRDDHISDKMKRIIKASRSGRITHFYDNDVHVAPELFDHPRAELLFESDPKLRATVKDRWGRGSRRPLVTFVDAAMLDLFRGHATAKFTTIIRSERPK